MTYTYKNTQTNLNNPNGKSYLESNKYSKHALIWPLFWRSRQVYMCACIGVFIHGECCTLLEIYLKSLLCSKTNTAGAQLSSYLLKMGISGHVRKPKQTPGKHHNGTGWTQTEGFHVKYSHFHASCIHPPSPPNTHKHTREPFMCLAFRSQEGMGTVEDWVMQLILLFLLTEGN